MKFNVKITRERRFFKHFQKKSTFQRVCKEIDEMATEHEKLAERCRQISQRLAELEKQADSK